MKLKDLSRSYRRSLVVLAASGNLSVATLMQVGGGGGGGRGGGGRLQPHRPGGPAPGGGGGKIAVRGRRGGC